MMVLDMMMKIRYYDVDDDNVDDDDDNDDDDDDLQSHMVNKLRQLNLTTLVLVH